MFREAVKTGTLVLVFFLLNICFKLDAQPDNLMASSLPVIRRLDLRDVLFKQYLDDVEAGRKAVFSRYPVKSSMELTAGLVIYSYTPVNGDDLLLIAARCNIPYDTFATLNRWQSVPALTQSQRILLPSMPGIFVPEEPQNDLEKLIFSSRGNAPGTPITIHAPDGSQQRFRFIPGDSFYPNERFFFLNPGVFRFPLLNYRVTSNYGMRISPISGRPKMHGGLDLAAPTGTPVFAVREGVVSETGSDAVFGKYVIIKHENGWTSLYGHLSSIEVKNGARLRQGALIGKVGSTGLSTGPHLHFELRENGKAQDPRRVLRQKLTN
ncbi:MAG: M23 family metallopeptidase [Termitinemataceae bacterium]|nr:MAG: M23 family metallopeptidase [Termitinemataceae bacterium]